MKLSDISYSNFKGNFYRYLMYALSNSLAVSVFFVFLNFISHPSLQADKLQGHGLAIKGTVTGLNLSLIIIVIFSFFFISYSTTTFLKSRGKELGLFSLYGMTNKQIRKLVRKENSLLSLFSIGQGLVIGLIFSKLFFLIMEYFTGISLVFEISKTALLVTIGVFFLLFEIINNIALFLIKDQQIVEQIKTDRTPKELPGFSTVKGLIAIILLAIGYRVAWIVEDAMVVLAMIPVTLIVIGGTYFLFTQFSILLANKIRGSRMVVYNKTNLISYSQLIFKLKDTAKVMFLASILIAVSFTATETIYSFYKDSGEVMGFETIDDIGIVYRGKDGFEGEYEEAKRDMLAYKDKIGMEEEVEFIVVGNKDSEKGLGVHGKGLVIGQSVYNKMREFGKQEPLDLKEGEAFFHHNDREYNGYKEVGEKFPVEEFTLSLGQVDKTFKKSGEKYGDFLSFMRLGYGNIFVVRDQVYEEFKGQAGKDEKVNYAMYKFKNPKESIGPGKKIEEKYFDSLSINSKEYSIEQMGKVYGTILFIGFFIALLFFIASGSVIYFKLFNEIETDRIEYEILRNIGMTKKDIKAIVSKQLRILFFLPFIVGSIHSLVALKSLSNMLSINLIKNGLVVSLSYFIFQIFFFIFIRRIYMKKLRIN